MHSSCREYFYIDDVSSRSSNFLLMPGGLHAPIDRRAIATLIQIPAHTPGQDFEPSITLSTSFISTWPTLTVVLSIPALARLRNQLRHLTVGLLGCREPSPHLAAAEATMTPGPGLGPMPTGL
jgi:hypothetical protein